MGTTCLSETPSPPSPESTVVREQISLHQLHLQSWRHGGDAVRLAIPLDPRWCLRVLRVPVPGRASRSSRQTWSADSPCAGKWWPPWSPRSAGRRRSTDGERSEKSVQHRMGCRGTSGDTLKLKHTTTPTYGLLVQSSTKPFHTFNHNQHRAVIAILVYWDNSTRG